MDFFPLRLAPFFPLSARNSPEAALPISSRAQPVAPNLQSIRVPLQIPSNPSPNPFTRRFFGPSNPFTRRFLGPSNPFPSPAPAACFGESRMPRGRKCILSPPPPQRRPPSGSQPNASTEVGTDGGRGSAGVWCEGASTGSPAASSSHAFHTEKPSNNVAAAEFSSPTTDAYNWGKDYRLVGGFLNYLQNSSSFPFPQHATHQPPMSQNSSTFPFPQHAPHQPPMSQNFHYVGGTSHYTPSLAPWPPAATGSPHAASAPQTQSFIHIDNGDDDGEGRTEKRLIWTQEEDVRLMSAWLNNSNDPIMGNNKKNDKYWGDVATSYNSTTPKNRRRLAKQTKDRWHKLNKWVNEFQCSWLKASRIYASGQSDDQLMGKAHCIYGEDYGGQFLHMSTWKAVRD